jgi:hypothetical protein
LTVFRVEKNRNYTVMSNVHLRDQNLSLKAKGLLSLLLSLPDDWHYSIRGLAKISKESPDGISSGLKELEAAGYLTRRQLRGERGRMGETEYTIYEEPRTPCLDSPCTENPVTVKPDTVSPCTDGPCSESPVQINTDKTKKDRSNTEMNKYLFHSYQEAAVETADEMGREREAYRELIRENISYDILIIDGLRKEDIDEIVEIMVDTVCSTKPFIVVGGDKKPAQVVKSQLMKLDSEHIRFVLDCMKENTTKIRNIRQYLLTTLYNAPVTISNYYGALVNHDLYGGN